MGYWYRLRRLHEHDALTYVLRTPSCYVLGM